MKLPKSFSEFMFWLLRQLPMWNYICPKCRGEVDEDQHVCHICGEVIKVPVRVPPKVLKDKKALSEYVHRNILPFLTCEQQSYLLNYFTILFAHGFEGGNFGLDPITGDTWSGTNGTPNIVSAASLFFYMMSGRTSPITGNPTGRHGFDVVHTTTIVECNLVIDGSSRTYLAYDSDDLGSEIRLYYAENITGPWTAYSGNPILGPTANRYRTPSVALVGGTLHMFLCRRDTRTIERWTSADGITFVEAEDVILSAEAGTTLNPFIWLNPNDNNWYLFWRNDDGVGNYKIYARNAALITGLAAAADATVLNTTRIIAYPTIMYRDALYWLLVEELSGLWHIEAFASNNVTAGYAECQDSAVLTEDEACPKLFLDSGGNCYLFTNRDSANWYQDVREVYTYSDTYVHHGTYAARSGSRDINDYCFVVGLVSASPRYSRIYFKFSALPSSGNGITLMSTFGSAIECRVGIYNEAGTVKWRLYSVPNGGGTWQTIATPNPLAHTWYCVEMSVTSGVGCELFIDGVSIGTKASVQVGAITTLYCGGWDKLLNDQVNVFWDCVVVADTRIYCEVAGGGTGALVAATIAKILLDG